jgi:hypothetical protein
MRNAGLSAFAAPQWDDWVQPGRTQNPIKEVSQELRAVLWRVVYDSFKKHAEAPTYPGPAYFRQPWLGTLRALHILRDHRMADEFKNNVEFHVEATKRIFEKGDYLRIFGWLQAVLRLSPPNQFAEQIDRALKYARAAYRVLDGSTIVPVGSDAELQTLERAFADLAATEFHGARAHLRNAAELLTAGKWADSIRESIHSVASVARVLEPSGEDREARDVRKNTSCHKEGLRCPVWLHEQ